MADRFCTFCGTRHEPCTDCPTRAERIPIEIVEAVARALYACEKRRADRSCAVLSAAACKPVVALLLEPWEECHDAFMSDAKAAINAYLGAAYTEQAA